VPGTDQNDPSHATSEHGDEPNDHPVSNRSLAMFFIALAAALVLGYLLLSKLVDMSREEDCALAHRKTCGATETR
jgi:hypothetical protein